MTRYAVLLPALEQGSPEWHRWRGSKYTSTSSPQPTPANGLTVGRPGSTFRSDAMRWGSQHERAIRDELSWTLGFDYQPMCVERAANRLHAASLDGLAPGSWCEIKAPYTGRSGTTWKSAHQGLIPEQHWRQMAHQALVLGVLDGCDDLAGVYAVAVREPRLSLDVEPGLHGWQHDGHKWMMMMLQVPIGSFRSEAERLMLRYERDAATVTAPAGKPPDGCIRA